jgi:hypothetical protein
MAIVGERFQIVIERSARLALNVQAGDRAIEVVDGNRMIVYFAPRPHRRSLRGRLGGYGTVGDFDEYRDGDAIPEASIR